MGMDARRTETTATCLHVGGLPLFSPVINAVDTSCTKILARFFPPLFEKLSPHYFNLRINRVKEKKRNKFKLLTKNWKKKKTKSHPTLVFSFSLPPFGY